MSEARLYQLKYNTEDTSNVALCVFCLFVLRGLGGTEVFEIFKSFAVSLCPLIIQYSENQFLVMISRKTEIKYI